MSYRNGNYCAFYVSEPFSESQLKAYATKDFVFYNTIKMWKGEDNSFPFIDSHNKTYNVRDNSEWETLKSRLRERLRNSKNIILILSKETKNSRALKEEIDYGINSLCLPIIVLYPDYSRKESLLNDNKNDFKKEIKDLWNNLPVFRECMFKVPTLHIPFKKDILKNALDDNNFMLNTKKDADAYFYKA